MGSISTVSIISLLLVVFVGTIQSQVVCPKIVSRSEWDARSAKTSPLQVNPPTHVVIHHSATAPCTTLESCSRNVKSFQNHHMDVNGWKDIGYNFLVGEDGNVYEGRGWDKTGAHAPTFNTRSIGICIIGTFTERIPNNAALKATKDLIACGVSQGKIKRNYKLIGHQQVTATICPGDYLFSEIQKWPEWTNKP